MPSFFRIYYDEKTVKKLTPEQWRKILREDYKRKSNLRKTVKVTPQYVYLRYGERGIWIRTAQLILALREAKVLTPSDWCLLK